MLFEMRLRRGLHDGTITLAFRRWRRAQVVAGHHYRTGTDMVCAEAIEQVTLADITAGDALAAGYPDVAALLADLRGGAELPLYRIRFRRLDGPDPRDELAGSATLTDAEAASIATRLARMDKASKRGPWTAAVLDQIAERPAVSSVFLAETLEWERADFKVHVRRLKALGLTISLDVGYRLSPRGRAYLASLHSSAGRDHAVPGRESG